MNTNLKTPGVYIVEQDAFPNSIVPVATAIPAFVGYTEKAIYNDKDLTHVPTLIYSLAEYKLFFGGGPNTAFEISTNTVGYELAFKSRQFLLYDSLRFFYENGGGACYIVSVGDYDASISKDDFFGEEERDGAKQLKGIDTLLKEQEPTMLVIPDAVLLSEAGCSDLQKKMIQHCGEEMRNRIAILDIYEGYKERSLDAEDVIERFRKGIGNEHLDFATAYYPWLETTVATQDEVDFMCINEASVATFIQLLKDESAKRVQSGEIDQKRADLINTEIDKIPAAAKSDDAAQTTTGEEDQKDIQALHNTLMNVCPRYKEVMHSILKKRNLLPPSGCMAGVYTSVDNNDGVWKAPANVGLQSVKKPAVSISHDEQEDLNAPLSGKAVNAIRTFTGMGTLVWGARTLDGNSLDWRYINVRRTAIFLEESIKYASQAYVFEPNVARTWVRVKSMIENFLNGMWKEGGLMGATPNDAYYVNVGLGSTMTGEDISNGIMRIDVKVAITRPAEFIQFTFEQQMQEN